MPQLGWSAHADGFIDFYNRRWYEYTGTMLAQMEGWGWRSVHDPELLPAIEEEWRRCLGTGEAFELEFPLRRHDRVFRRFVTRARPLRDGTGKIVRWVGVNADIDDVRAAHALRGEMIAQGHEAETMLLEMRAAKERAEARVAELEAELKTRALGSR
jgi:PAS domain S-box-containing protein